jgi:hypothetical protein
MAKVRWKRRGEEMEDNVLLIFGYRLSDKNEFIKCGDHTTTMIRPLDFDDFTLVEFTLEEIDGEFPVTFKFGFDVYFSDIPLINAIMELAQSVLWNRVDAVLANASDEQEETTDFTLR